MKVLSLFDGMGCGAIAFTKLGIPLVRYVACEIDKYAVQAASHNFPYIEQHGDVFKADFSEYTGFDWVIGGSPCTYWSIAQKNNRETEASGLGWELFSQYVRAVKEAKPKYFLYENNKSMSKKIRASITETFGFGPILINSALVSAQNRQRLYWVGIRQADGTYRKADIEQPEDKGILLRDILDNAVKETIAEPVNITVDGKAQTLRATCYKDGIRNMVGNAIDRKTCVAEPVCIQEHVFGRKACNDGSYDRRFEAREDGKSGTLTPTMRQNAIAEPAIDNDKPIYEVRNGLIAIRDKQYPIKLADGYYIIRKLSVNECKRLQTVPEWYDFSVISNSQAYKCLGNGWTVDVIAWLLSNALCERS